MGNVEEGIFRSKNWKWLKPLLITLIVLLLFSFLILRVWFSSKAVEIAYEIDGLMDEKKRLEEENKQLSIKIAELESPERISLIAVNELNMVRSTDAEVIILDK
ncbi:hypothetical protein GF312_10075 [Candidatus Poribacteria bacterium]|nr:hypothetical protein [Candidatus Poribacteria bacterium]